VNNLLQIFIFYLFTVVES